jgi:hypothetical protein
MTMGASLYIMDKMKRLLFVFIAIMFLANSFAVSAWAKPCANMSMSDMPCHEQQDESSPLSWMILYVLRPLLVARMFL